MRRITLYRKVKGRMRYYKIGCHKDLFGQFVVERIYGSVGNSAPTGIKIDRFDSCGEALDFIQRLIRIKRQKGYFFLSSFLGTTNMLI